jgi:hypothetical protein
VAKIEQRNKYCKKMIFKETQEAKAIATRPCPSIPHPMKSGQGGGADQSTRRAASSWGFNADMTAMHTATPAPILISEGGILLKFSSLLRALAFQEEKK